MHCFINYAVIKAKKRVLAWRKSLTFVNALHSKTEDLVWVI